MKLSWIVGIVMLILVIYIFATGRKREGAAIPNFSDGGPASDDETRGILPPMIAFR